MTERDEMEFWRNEIHRLSESSYGQWQAAGFVDPIAARGQALDEAIENLISAARGHPFAPLESIYDQALGPFAAIAVALESA